MLILHSPSYQLVIIGPLMGKVNFREYLISQFNPTHEICKNFMYTKIHVLQYFFLTKAAIHADIPFLDNTSSSSVPYFNTHTEIIYLQKNNRKISKNLQ